MAFHSFNHGYTGQHWRGNAGFDHVKHQPGRRPQVGGVETAPPAQQGYLHYIRGGLSNSVTAMTGIVEDYHTNGNNPNDGTWVLGDPYAAGTACNNYNYRGTNGGWMTNGMIMSSKYSRMEHFSHKMCWGQDDCFNQWTFWSAPPTQAQDFSNCIGSLNFYATGSYYGNNIYLYTSQGSGAQQTQVGSWVNNYTGTHAARFPWDFTFFNDGIQTTQMASRIGSGGAGSINMRGLGFNLPDYFYIQFYCYIYSSYCQSCTADVWDIHHFQETLP